ncbi:MAG: hypothetical protein ACREKL_14650 [Chthoniobacterales bacterium]
MRRAFCFLTLALIAGFSTARGASDIWSALVLAGNEQPAKPVPKELEPFAAGLRSIFGYNTFYLMAAGQEQIRKGDEEWIVPTKQVFMKLRCLDRTDGVYRLQIELYVKKKAVANSEVKLARGAPLYVRGPGYGRGRLVFILEVR